MVPDPLHPAVVHLPLALAVLIPLLALAAAFVVQRGWLPTRGWAAIVLLQALLVGTTWLALESGEGEEDRVERIVAERHIESHEEAAERFLALGVAGLIVAASGLLAGRAGAIQRVATVVLSLIVLASAFAVGRSGGELVYTHGAANAYLAESGVAAGPSTLASRMEHGEHEHEDDDD